ncbi:hypothetical protein PPACK8108_LOCUS23026 [Phakopsora pachyrhizi]|uniref:Uncharacterized protein n=1 Tax=Phakopsora pachyrhizi TaxID=170000 RepID=A0AAV0BNM8_PHAPC|nr:hypothetical protein PPACK8108_LOCUS23026 [Phakopsora pachyrhizi]
MPVKEQSTRQAGAGRACGLRQGRIRWDGRRRRRDKDGVEAAREDSGEVSVGLVRRWRRTDIRYISKAVVEGQSDKNHWRARARRRHTVVRSSYHFSMARGEDWRGKYLLNCPLRWSTIEQEGRGTQDICVLLVAGRVRVVTTLRFTRLKGL